jgi:hypothetical protein
MLELGERGMGCPVEMEFSVNLTDEDHRQPQFAFLQLRPMTARAELEQVDISSEEIDDAFCISGKALGNAEKQDMADLIFVKPETFDPGKTMEIAREIARLNAALVKGKSKIPAHRPGPLGIGGPLAGNSRFMGRYFRGGCHDRNRIGEACGRTLPGLAFFSQHHHPGDQLHYRLQGGRRSG